jgi:hypothetical protein
MDINPCVIALTLQMQMVRLVILLGQAQRNVLHVHTFTAYVQESENDGFCTELVHSTQRFTHLSPLIYYNIPNQSQEILFFKIYLNIIFFLYLGLPSALSA